MTDFPRCSLHSGCASQHCYDCVNRVGNEARPSRDRRLRGGRQRRGIQTSEAPASPVYRRAAPTLHIPSRWQIAHPTSMPAERTPQERPDSPGSKKGQKIRRLGQHQIKYTYGRLRQHQNTNGSALCESDLFIIIVEILTTSYLWKFANFCNFRTLVTSILAWPKMTQLACWDLRTRYRMIDFFFRYDVWELS